MIALPAVGTCSYEILITSILLIILLIFFWVNFACIIPVTVYESVHYV